jgi:hypothetical protein
MMLSDVGCELVPAEPIVSAAPRKPLVDSDVPRPQVRVGPLRPAEQVDRRLQLAVALQAGLERRHEGAFRGRDVRLADGRVEAADREVRIVLHRHPHRIVPRHLEHRAGRLRRWRLWRRRGRGSNLCVGWCGHSQQQRQQRRSRGSGGCRTAPEAEPELRQVVEERVGDRCDEQCQHENE